MKNLYDYVRNKLGGYKCYKTNKILTKKVFEGRIRSMIEENSSDSRQHYFRGGKLMNSEWRQDIFSNKKLREMNEIIEWKPYNRVRGNIWELCPGNGRPNDNLLNIAETLYLKKGMRGRNRVSFGDIYIAIPNN